MRLNRLSKLNLQSSQAEPKKGRNGSGNCKTKIEEEEMLNVYVVRMLNRIESANGRNTLANSVEVVEKVLSQSELMPKQMQKRKRTPKLKIDEGTLLRWLM